jgi:mono/diheme cytochrome c family protein
VLVAIVAGAPALGRGAEPLPGGKEEAYLQYCASCHGVSGKGDGPAAGALTPQPTDLTRLAASAGGELSQADLRQAIDGTRSIRAHGDSKMPVWGEVFRPEAPVPVPAAPRSKLMLITDYVSAIQAK